MRFITLTSFNTTFAIDSPVGEAFLQHQPAAPHQHQMFAVALRLKEEGFNIVALKGFDRHFLKGLREPRKAKVFTFDL